MTPSDGPWPAPAKLNLMLRVVGQRTDGYHELQTVFQFLGHGDSLSFRIRRDGGIRRRSDLAGVPEDADLSVRAARLLQSVADTSLGVDIDIDKRLPIGGGLGGGSSNAATTLHALNAIWGIGLPADELARLGLELGADVPVFVSGEAAWAEGVGERLRPVAPVEPWYLVIAPDIRVSTAAVFQHPELTRNSPRITIRDFLAGTCGNDCWPVVRQEYPEISAAYDWLSRFGEARLTGTGACLFVAFDDERPTREALAQLPEGWLGFVARGRNRSPLMDRLAQQSAGA